jgi:iron(III) transport system ATP-binding protein
MNGLEVRGLYKAFGSQSVLREADLDVAEGSLTAILGSSGSGKTTLLRMLAGFERPDGGVIRVGGRVVDDDRTHLAPQSRSVGFVPQEGALFPHLDVAANIGFGLPRRGRRDRVAELLELTDLGPLSGRYPHELSGGQQQRVALARSLAPQPRLMLLDEPFSSLDAALRTTVRHEVAAVLARTGTTTVLVTHDQDEALSMADSVAVLRHGHFVQCGPPDEIYARPVDAEIASFVGDANLVPGRSDGRTAETVLGRLTLVGPSAPGPGPVTVLVRPEQIALVADGVAGAVPGTVRRCEYFGHDTVLAVELAPGRDPASAAAVQVRLAGESPLRPGAPVTLLVSGPTLGWPA